MNTTAGLRRLEQILPRLSGDKGLRDEAIALVRAMIDAQAEECASTEWWATYGPRPSDEWRPGIPLPPKSRALVDCIVLNGPSPVPEVARHLGIKETNARRLVNRADDELTDRGCKATISIAGGMVQTSSTHTATTIIVSSDRRRIS
jgi:hypothetical protein